MKFKRGDIVRLKRTAKGWSSECYSQQFIVGETVFIGSGLKTLELSLEQFPDDFVKVKKITKVELTSLSDDELREIYCQSDGILEVDLYRAIANAAIKRYIEDSTKEKKL
jgi:hypothetical protein